MNCECESPVMDVEHDAGCRRCGLPVNFTRRTIDEGTYERMADSMVQRRLGRDPRYRNAATAEAQAAAEAAIEREVCDELDAKYRIGELRGDGRRP